jgi:hypothetical protein
MWLFIVSFQVLYYTLLSEEFIVVSARIPANFIKHSYDLFDIITA